MAAFEPVSEYRKRAFDRVWRDICIFFFNQTRKTPGAGRTRADIRIRAVGGRRARPPASDFMDSCCVLSVVARHVSRSTRPAGSGSLTRWPVPKPLASDGLVSPVSHPKLMRRRPSSGACLRLINLKSTDLDVGQSRGQCPLGHDENVHKLGVNATEREREWREKYFPPPPQNFKSDHMQESARSPNLSTPAP